MDKLVFEVESLENLADDVKSMYDSVSVKDANGSEKSVYRLKVDGVVGAKDFETVRGALESERKIRKEYESLAKKYGEHTPEKVQSMIEELTTLRANGTQNAQSHEYIKKFEEFKSEHQRSFQETKKEYDAKIAELSTQLTQKEQMLTTMKMTDVLKEVYREKGEPTMFDAFATIAVPQLEWNADRGEFCTKDGLYNASEFFHMTCNKMPGFLKANVSANAREGGGGDNWDQYFNPASPAYNLDEQVRLMKKDRIRGLDLVNKYRKK